MKVLDGVDVSRETFERLETFQGLAVKWNKSINLVSKSTIDDFWTRHIVDSAQIFSIAPHEPRHWADFGSGGGFPGLVLAILYKEFSPKTRFTLVESDKRKSSFLMTAAFQLGLSVEVKSERIEKIEPLSADVISARALAALPDLLAFMDIHASTNAVGLFPKGRTGNEEVDLAKMTWDFDVESYKSKTNPDAQLFKVMNLQHG